MSAYDTQYYAIVPITEATNIATQYSGLGVDVVNGTQANGVFANFTYWKFFRKDADLIWREYVGVEWLKSLFNFNQPKRNIVLNAGGSIFEVEGGVDPSDYRVWFEQNLIQDDYNNFDDFGEYLWDPVTFETVPNGN